MTDSKKTPDDDVADDSNSRGASAPGTSLNASTADRYSGEGAPLEDSKVEGPTKDGEPPDGSPLAPSSKVGADSELSAGAEPKVSATTSPAAPTVTPRGSHLFFRRVKLTTASRYFSLELRPALHAIVLEGEADSQKFIESACGMSFPARGRVTYGRTSPGKSPSLRRNIGSLLPWEPPLLRTPTVRDHVAHVLSLRKELGAESLSDPNEVPFVKDLLDASPQDLNVHDRRRIAFGLALSLTRPIALLLYDPLAAASDDEIPLVLSHLHQQEEAGATIACVVPSRRAAALLTTRIHSILSEVPKSESGAHFLLRSERPRELASLLSTDPCIIATRVHPEISGELSIEATSEEEGARAITSAVARCGVMVFEMRRTTRSQWSVTP